MVYQNPPFMIMSREESAREQKRAILSISQMMMRQCLSLLLKNVPALDTLGQGSRY